eukprot:COSAG02_NODE_2681_length_8253_cov_7.455482_3_plen_63_part_00
MIAKIPLYHVGQYRLYRYACAARRALDPASARGGVWRDATDGSVRKMLLLSTGGPRIPHSII